MSQRSRGPRNRNQQALWAFWPFFTSFGGFLVAWGLAGLIAAAVMYLGLGGQDRAQSLERIESGVITSVILIALGACRILWLRHRRARMARTRH